MRQHAGLDRQVVVPAKCIEHTQQGGRVGDAVGCGIDADDSVADAVEQPIEDRQRDPARIVCGMVRLQTGGEAPWKAEGRAERGHHPALARDGDEILVAHQLRHARDHFGRQAGRDGCQGGGIGLACEQPIAKIPDGHAGKRREGRCVVAVDDQPRDLVLFVGNEMLGQERLQRQVGQRIAGRDPLCVGASGKAGEFVAGAVRRGRGEKSPQIREAMARAAEILSISHVRLPCPQPTIALNRRNCVSMWFVISIEKIRAETTESSPFVIPANRIVLKNAAIMTII